MATAYPINPNFGVILSDQGKVIPVNNDGPIDPDDREELLTLALAGAVEVAYLVEELKRVARTMQEALAEMANAPVAEVQ